VRRFVIAAMWAVAGYLAGAFGGGFLISTFSSNQENFQIRALRLEAARRFRSPTPS
jgi:hypothetical protein